MADLECRPVSRQEAEDAVRTLLRWAGDDPEREGLRDTPSRVVRSYEEFFAGYGTAATRPFNSMICWSVARVGSST